MYGEKRVKCTNFQPHNNNNKKEQLTNYKLSSFSLYIVLTAFNLKNIMNLSEKYAKNILKAMFKNYDFNYIISTPDDDMILFEIDTNKLDTENNQIELYISKIRDESNQIQVEVSKRSEDYETIGMYYIDEDYFEQTSSFWETMFNEHLLF